MLLYAERTDLPDDLDLTDREKDRYIRSASRLVGEAIEFAEYHALPNGLPYRQELRDACTEAVVTQVEFWKRENLVPGALPTGVAAVKKKNRTLADRKLDIEYADTRDADRARQYAADSLCEEALWVLRSKGLTEIVLRRG